MAKKSKRKSAPRSAPSDRVSDTPDYTNRRELENMVKRIFRHSAETLGKVEPSSPHARVGMDLDPARRKRRVSATVETAGYVRTLVQDICPDIPDLFSIEEDWAYVNSLPISSYDLLEESDTLTLSAAIWMLDHIKENGNIRKAISLLPKDDGTLDDVECPPIWDPCHSDEVIRAMVYAIQERNSDCVMATQGRSKKKHHAQDRLMRYFADIYTTENKQHQEVPSRIRFEALLRLIDPESIQTAVAHFREKVEEWIVLYFRCRAIYAAKELDLKNRYEAFEDRSFSKLHTALESMEGKTLSMPQAGDMLPGGNGLLSLTGANRLHQMMNDPLQIVMQYDDENERYEEESHALTVEIAKFVFFAYRQSAFPFERVKNFLGEDIANYLLSFTIDDPYEICFALLYLLDTGDDLPWLYFPGLALAANAGAKLPWADGEYWEDEDESLAQYYDSEYDHTAMNPAKRNVKNVPELHDWYRLDYSYRPGGPEYQQRNNLSQILYEITGCLMPRNPHRFDTAILHLKNYGITGKKMQLPFLYCAMLLGEARQQSSDWRLGLDLSDEEQISKIAQESEKKPDETAEDTADNQLIAELATLKKENDHLRKTVYEADRASRDLQKRYDALLHKSGTERQELADLREIVFNQENQIEDDESNDTAIELPYTVRHTIVVFGGHDSWTKAIKPMLEGDIRFIDRDMRPNADLIRHADVVWIQSNSISHKHFYKIIDIVRTNDIQIRYFKYASAEKCALQLANVDTLMA